MHPPLRILVQQVTGKTLKTLPTHSDFIPLPAKGLILIVAQDGVGPFLGGISV